jgi:hypothetical protein
MTSMIHQWMAGVALFMGFVLPGVEPQTSPPRPQPPKPAEKHTPEEAWADLASPKAEQAYRAISDLVAQPDPALTLLKTRLSPAGKNERLTQLLKDLDGRQFGDRDRAMRALEQLGHQAEPALQRILEGKPSPDLRKRVEELLAKVKQPITDPTILQVIRAVEVLERISSPAARQLLEELAQGDPDARLTREAHASLDRLRNKGPIKP